MKNIKIWKILIGILFIYSFSHCSHKNSYGQDWYSEFYKGYGNAVEFSTKITHLNGNSFLLGQNKYCYTVYSIWSYFSVDSKNYIIIYKVTDKSEILQYRVYHYNQSIDWLYQYNNLDVRYEVFRKGGILDGDPFYFSSLIHKEIKEYSLDMSLDIFQEDDTTKFANEFLRNLRNDIIKYNLIEFSTLK